MMVSMCVLCVGSRIKRASTRMDALARALYFACATSLLILANVYVAPPCFSVMLSGSNVAADASNVMNVRVLSSLTVFVATVALVIVAVLSPAVRITVAMFVYLFCTFCFSETVILCFCFCGTFGSALMSASMSSSFVFTRSFTI